MAKYLDNDGLLYFWQKIKAVFAQKTELPSASSTTPSMDGTGATGSSTDYARADHVHPTDTSRAPTSHASSATTYGKGTNGNYGHVKLSDATNATTAAASGGTAATPKAVSDALAAAKSYADTNDADTTYTLGTTGSGSSRKVTLTAGGSGSGTQSVDVPDTDTTYSDFTGATSSAAGAHGLVPAPAKGDQNDILFGDGEWDSVSGTTNANATIVTPKIQRSDGTALVSFSIYGASSTQSGAMVAADKAKLDGIDEGAQANQNAFSNVKVGSTTVAADSATDTIEFVAGANVTLTPDATDDKVTIAATHPAYDAATAAAVKVGRDATGHVVIGDALTASDVGAAASSHKHAASDVTSGTFDAARIPNLAASKITSGTLGVARGGTGVSTLGAGVVYHSASGTGALSIASAANLVSAIGNTAVNRATADASGNNIADTYAKKTDLAGMYRYMGSVANEAALPTTGMTTGDVYNIEAASSYGGAGANVAWNGTAWDSLGEIFTINSITNSEIDTIVAS